jgi:hypothetical protein
MKKILAISILISAWIPGYSQHPKIKPDLPHEYPPHRSFPVFTPVKPRAGWQVHPSTQLREQSHSPGTVNIIPLGTSGNAFGYGYAGGQRSLVWADDCLNTLINIHTMGPDPSIPGIEGYLAVDYGVNRGQQASEWQINRQIYAPEIPSGTGGFTDAAIFPQGGIYNPYGNLDPDSAYIPFFAANLTNNNRYGGYSYGTANLTDPTDSTRHLRWYSPPPYTSVPGGFTVTRTGKAFTADLDLDYSGPVPVYKGNIITGTGTWNPGTRDFDYSFDTIPLPTYHNVAPCNVKIAAGPDGQTVWIAVIANNGEAAQIGDSANLYPIFIYSTDGGIHWNDPEFIQIDGDDGFYCVEEYLLSDYRITQLYNPPYPSRTEIPFTTAFDCDLVVTHYGEAHLAVVIGVQAGEYSISTFDSCFGVYDIYAHWGGLAGYKFGIQFLGYLRTFRGYFGSVTEDNRVNISTNLAGNEVVVTWNDTQEEGVTSNNHPDVFARGFNPDACITTSPEGNYIPTNVTASTPLEHNAAFLVASPYLFTGEGSLTVPMVTESMSDTNDPSMPVTYYYISNFSFYDEDYMQPAVCYCPWDRGHGTRERFRSEISREIEPCYFVPTEIKPEMKFEVSQNYPNPFVQSTVITVSLPVTTHMVVEVSNIFGERCIILDQGKCLPGKHNITLDASSLRPGTYFYSIFTDETSITKKMLVFRD